MVPEMTTQETTRHQMERCRVCLCVSLFPPLVGGAEKQAQALAKELVRQGQAVTVVTRRLPGLPAREVMDGVEVCRAIRVWDCGPMFGLTYVLSLAAFLLRHQHRFDVIQATYLYLDAFAAAVLRRILRKPVIVRPACGGVDGDLRRLGQLRFWPLVRGLDRPTVGLLLRVIQSQADAVVALSRELEAELSEAGFPPERVVWIPNGVDVSRFHPPDPTGRPLHRLGVPSANGPSLLFVGRLHAQKNLPILLHAAAELRQQWPRLRVILVGDGPERGSLGRLVTDLGLGDMVRFVGEVNDVLTYLHGADLFVHPSRSEGMPGALLEAMACGLPCVATRIGGTVDVMRDGEEGLLVPAGDVRALRGAIGRLLEDPALARRLGRQARATVEARFSMAHVAQQYRALYKALVGGQGPAAALRQAVAIPGARHGD
jgi:glycosyltransferase involved in cell wall biosynthesis